MYETLETNTNRVLLQRPHIVTGFNVGIPVEQELDGARKPLYTGI
jgi:hypothetical protein